jgi:rRNA maturation protein Rpf1
MYSACTSVDEKVKYLYGRLVFFKSCHFTDFYPLGKNIQIQFKLIKYELTDEDSNLADQKSNSKSPGIHLKNILFKFLFKMIVQTIFQVK